MGKLDGRVAVVTGGNSGIGLATAAAFQAEGARVVICGRDARTLDEAARALGGDVLAVAADVTRLDDLDRLFAATRERFGGVDILFVNAGTATVGPIEAMTEAIVDDVMATNFKGAYFTTRRRSPSSTTTPRSSSTAR